jgi:hypothetical protein
MARGHEHDHDSHPRIQGERAIVVNLESARARRLRKRCSTLLVER